MQLPLAVKKTNQSLMLEKAEVPSVAINDAEVGQDVPVVLEGFGTFRKDLSVRC